MNKFALIESFTIQDAINTDIDSNTVFIIANERIKKNNRTGRYFTIFPSFKSFLKVRDRYQHCHEILLDHKNNKKNPSGRLVFDFDIVSEYIPDNFKDQIEYTVCDVAKRYMRDVDADRFEFVWLSSENTKKFSKHLVVKNMLFDDWMRMSSLFYRLFCDIWDRSQIWIKSKDLIDFQIIKKNASLRMAGSRKVDGNVLTIDDARMKLEDTLIRVYLSKQKKNEQMVTKKNIQKEVFDTILKPKHTHVHEGRLRSVKMNTEPIKFEDSVYKRAFEEYNKLFPKVFQLRRHCEDKIFLTRVIPSECNVCKKIHDNENACLHLIMDSGLYEIYFQCYRNCENRVLYIGSLTIGNLTFMENEKLNKPITRTFDSNLNI